MKEWLGERKVVAIMLKHCLKEWGWTITITNRLIPLEYSLPQSFQKNVCWCTRRIKFILCKPGKLIAGQGDRYPHTQKEIVYSHREHWRTLFKQTHDLNILMLDVEHTQSWVYCCLGLPRESRVRVCRCQSRGISVLVYLRSIAGFQACLST